MDRRDALGLAAFVGVVAVVAALSSLSAVSAADIYDDLEGPSWAPPPWLFGPVWSVLYLTIAVAGWLVWREGATFREPPLLLFVAQLALNGLWSPMFFAWGQRGAALVVILALDVVVVSMMIVFARRRRAAALLLAPYLAWILFASALNAAYWWLNRGAA